MADPWLVSPRLCRWCGKNFVRPPGWPWLCETPTCLARCEAFSIKRGDGSYIYLPLPVQVEIMEAHAPITPEADQITHILFGGAAGASKSHAVRFGAYWWAMAVPKCRILLLREVSDELMRSHIIGLMDVEAELLGADFRSHPHPLARWPNGSFIEGGHMEDAESVKRYLSSEYDIIIPEEGSLYDPDALLELTTRARTTNEVMRKRGGARVWIPTNPGGPSTTVLRDLFLDQHVDAEEWPSLAAEYRPHEWIHIPGRLDDNPYMDASYERKLSVIRQQWRFKQLRFGDWYAVSGLFFDTFSTAIHVTSEPVSSPQDQQWFRSLDWGYKDKAVMLWWVVLDDGDLHVAAELVFSGKTPEEIDPAVKEMDRELGVPTVEPLVTWASPDMWARRGQIGEFIYQTANRCGWNLRKANTPREQGWMRLQTLLRVSGGTPGLTIHARCRYLVKSFLVARAKENHPEDITDDDDHALESCRYGAMSRPKPRYRSEPRRDRTWEADFAPQGPVRVGRSTFMK